MKEIVTETRKAFLALCIALYKLLCLPAMWWQHRQEPLNWSEKRTKKFVDQSAVGWFGDDIRILECLGPADGIKSDEKTDGELTIKTEYSVWFMKNLSLRQMLLLAGAAIIVIVVGIVLLWLTSNWTSHFHYTPPVGSFGSG